MQVKGCHMREQRLCNGTQQGTDAGAQAQFLTWASDAEAELVLIGCRCQCMRIVEPGGSTRASLL